MKKVLLIFALILTSKTSNAQELESILLAGDDAEKLTNAYLNPVMKGLIYSMNNGWYHTAKVHKKLGFDISISANASFIPEKDEIFNLAALGLSSTFDKDTSPTVAGSEDITPSNITYSTTIEGQTAEASFQLPSGIKGDLPLNAIPTPIIQVGLGLPYKLEAMLRIVPKVGTDDVKGGLFGIGLKKEITDWFGPIDKTPLHVSLLAAYTNMNVDYTIGNVMADNIETTDASAEFKLNSYTIQAIASLNLPVFNVYGGVGYNGGSTKLNMLGTYNLIYETPLGSAEVAAQPFNLSSSTGSFNATIGARLSLGFFKLFGSYSLQEYNSLNAGIAFSFR